jgi:uncharacterized protein DUF3987/primase/DNA polymerase family protein
VSDQEVIDKAKAARNGGKFSTLFYSGWQGTEYPSWSEADAALCSMLAFWTRDENQIDRIFRQSALMREKWDKRHHADGRTYGQATIERALGSVTQTYQGAAQPKEKKESEHTEEPIPLIPEQEPPLPYPLDALGEVLGNAAQAIAEYVQVPKAMAGQSVLAAAALALQPFYDVDVPSLGRPRPLSLNALTIAESGDRKSSTDKQAIYPIHAYQHTLWSAYEEDKEAYEAALDDYLGTPKKNRLGRAEPIAPRAPFILVDEPTLEGIHRTFREGRPSLGLFNDEGGQFIGGHAMSKDHVLKTISGLSKLWDGHPVSRVRGGKDESYLLFGKRFSCHLMTQPIVANSLLADKLLMGQGLLARFLITQPASLAGTRLYKDSDPSADKRLGLYWKTMTAWLEKPMSENEHNELTPTKLPLTQEAKALWVKAYDAIEKELSPVGGACGHQALRGKGG